MFLSCFSDELCLDFPKTLPILKGWGLEYVDLRNRVFGKTFADLGSDQLKKMKGLLRDHGMKVGCLQSYLAKEHLPNMKLILTSNTYRFQLSCLKIVQKYNKI